MHEMPDAVINIVDGTNIERNLYLSTQIIELGIPVIIAVNMMDVIEKNGDKIHIENLSEKLGCKVVEISALKGNGIKELVKEAVKLAQSKKTNKIVHQFSEKVEDIIRETEGMLEDEIPESQKRFIAIKLLEKDKNIADSLKVIPNIIKQIETLENTFDDDTESIITNERYEYISSIIKECYTKKNSEKLTISDKIDRVVTNRWLALPIFAAIMFVVYYVSVTTVGTIVTDWTNDVLFGEIIPPAVEKVLVALNCTGWSKV